MSKFLFVPEKLNIIDYPVFCLLILMTDNVLFVKQRIHILSEFLKKMFLKYIIIIMQKNLFKIFPMLFNIPFIFIIRDFNIAKTLCCL